MKAPLQLTMAITQPHSNQYLFSDHYLDNLLHQDPRWAAALPEAEAFLEWLQQLYAQEQKQLAKYTESQLEDQGELHTQIDNLQNSLKAKDGTIKDLQDMFEELKLKEKVIIK